MYLIVVHDQIMADFVAVSDYVVDINYCSINICMCLLMFIYVDDDTAVNMPYNNNNNNNEITNESSMRL